MTHKEAVKKALEMLGGKALLKQIYPVAIKLIGNNTQSKDIKATIRRELNSSPLVFKSTPGQEGSWELLFYQEELAKRDEKIAELEASLLAKNNEFKAVKTEDGFVSRLIEKLCTFWKDDKKTICEFRKVLDLLGRADVVEELDTLLEKKAKKVKMPISKNPDKIVVNGDYVVNKQVDYEVNNVETGGIGIQINHNSHREDVQQEDASREISPEELARAIESCQEYFWGNSSYAVLFCLQRDVQKKEMSQTAFERMVEMLPYRGKRDFQCPTGTIANAFSDNGFLKYHISKWEGMGAPQRAVTLLNKLREALKL